MPDLHFSISFPLVLIVLAFTASFAASFFTYRITVPPVSRKVLISLIILRGLGIFLIFFLIGEPLLFLITRHVEQPVVAVLIDNSRSMSVKDRSGLRGEALKSVLRSESWKKIGSKGEVRYFCFDNRLNEFGNFSADSLKLDGDLTDISAVLKSLKSAVSSSNLQSVVLITDGNFTSGMNPVYESEELGVPVFTVGIGDTSEQKDVLVKKIQTNDIAYVGTKVPLHVTVRSSGYGGERISVSLKCGQSVLDEKSITLDRGTRDYQLDFSFVPGEEGVQKYRIETSGLPGEITVSNNYMNYFIKVLKSKLRVVLIAGSPGPDAAFIRRSLSEDKNIELKSFIERKGGTFYGDAPSTRDFREIDCIVTTGYPAKNSNLRTLQMILGVMEAQVPVFMVLGRSVDFEKINMMDRIMPFTAEKTTEDEMQVFVDVPEMQFSNPVLKTGDGLNTAELWYKLPPVFRMQGTFRPKVGSQVLAYVRYQSIKSKSGEPFIVARNSNGKKVLAVLGYGLWRWKMLSVEEDKTESVFDAFLSNSIRWLTTREDEKRIIVRPVKNIFSTQDPVEFVAQAYDDNYQPMDNAEIEIMVKKGSEINPLLMNPLGSGQYRAEYGRMPEGEYMYVANVTENGKTVGEDKGTFSVGGINSEYIETRMNKSLLRQIAARTGGNYHDGNRIESIAEDITSMRNFTPRNTDSSVETDIWNSRWTLGIIICIFAAEWVLRKQNGML
jgi:hypothetical protein